MSLFLVLSAPLWLMLVISFYPMPGRGWRSIVIPFLGGTAAGIAAVALTLSLLTRIPFGKGTGQIFFWAWIRGPGWAFLPLSALLIFLFKKRPTSYSRIREISCWYAGVSFIYVLWLALSPEPGFNAYRVLFLPFVWMAASGGTAWLMDRGLRLDRGLSWLLLAVSVLFASFVTFAPVLYALGMEYWAWITTLLLTVFFGFLIFLDSRGRLG